LVNRRGEGFVGSKGDNVYAGRDGNAYRRDANGNWSKWENGSWNNVQRPDGSVRDSFMSQEGRQRDRQQGNFGRDSATGGRDGAMGDRAGDRGNRPQQLDRSTYNNLNRDMMNRREGTQRTRDLGTYQNRSISRPSNPGSYRGGGFGGGGMRGGGMRGGGRRR
jgi:hypothetical protein